MKVSWVAVFGTIGAVLLCLLAGVVGGGLTARFAHSEYTVSYADFISILLTAISLLMTLLAFFIAIIAVIGWNALTKGAQLRVQEFLEHGFRDGNALDRMFEKYAERAANRAGYKGVDRLDQERDDELARADEVENG